MSNRVVVVHSCADEALDLFAMDGTGTLKEWLKTRDPAVERVVPGALVTHFHVQPIKQSVLDRYVNVAPDEYTANARAFACGVQKIENLVSAETLETVAIFEPKGKVASAGPDATMFTDEQLEHVAGVFKQDIGAIARQRSFLVRRRGQRYSVPLSVLSVIALLTLPSAAEAQTEQTTQTTDEP